MLDYLHEKSCVSVAEVLQHGKPSGAGSLKINFVTNLPAAYKLACFEVAGRTIPGFRVTFTSETGTSKKYWNAVYDQWRSAVASTTFAHKFMRPAHFRTEWLSIAGDPTTFPIYGVYSSPGAVISILVRILLQMKFGIWTSSTIMDRRHDSQFRHRLKKLMFKQAAVVLVPGARAEEYTRALGARRVVHTPNCIDVARFHADLTEARRAPVRDEQSGTSVNCLYVGRLAPEKDVERLLLALSLVESSVRAALSVTIVGEGPQRHQLMDMANQLGLTDIISFVGLKIGSELAGYYHWADVLVLPSLSEPWGLVVNEAMQADVVPVVSSKVGCIPELIAPSETGFIFEAGDERDLARQLTQIASNPESIRALKGAAARRIADFTPAAFARGIAEGVTEAVGR